MSTATEIRELQKAGRFREAGIRMAELDRELDFQGTYKMTPTDTIDAIANDAGLHLAAQTSVDCPPPGIYEDVPFEDYLTWNAVSNSRLTQAMRSLAHFRSNTFKEPSKELRLGSLVHSGRLEPLSIAQRYAVMPPFEKDAENVTKKGDRSFAKTTVYYLSKAEQFEIANRGKEIVSEDQYDKMLGCVDGIARNERASRWLNTPGPVEVSIVWQDPTTGIFCKARIDKAAADWSIIVDLKTTRDASEFERSIANFGYHRQSAHYTRGVEVLTGIRPRFGVAAIETSDPFCCRAAQVKDSAIAAGRREIDELLAAIATAYETDSWPGYDDPEEWDLPSWYATNQEQSIGDWLKSEGSTTGE